ncbi:MAG: dienelactone hydrolase family protein, partial [Candidatus Limnocylindria bacterium]
RDHRGQSVAADGELERQRPSPTEAERDPLAPPAAARVLEERLRAAGRRGAVKLLPGVAAGFLDAGRHAVFDAVAAAEAWDRLLGFLRAELT